MDQIERTARLIRSQGRRRVLRHPGADRRAVVGPVAARQPRPARAARVHARRRRRAAQDRPHVPGDRALRRRADDHEPRHRRGAGHGAVAQGRPDAARGDAPRAARLADGAADRARDRPGRRGLAAGHAATARRSTARAPTRSSRPGWPTPGPPRRRPRPRPTMRDQVSPTTNAGLGTHDAGPAEARDRAPGRGSCARRSEAAERERKAQAAGAAGRRAPAREDDRDRDPHRRPGRDLARRASRCSAACSTRSSGRQEPLSARSHARRARSPSVAGRIGERASPARGARPGRRQESP